MLGEILLEFFKMGATEKLKLILDGKLSCADNLKKFLENIEKDNERGKKINAVLHLNHNALEDAKKVDYKIKKKEKLGKLAGLGIIVKSNMCSCDNILFCIRLMEAKKERKVNIPA